MGKFKTPLEIRDEELARFQNRNNPTYPNNENYPLAGNDEFLSKLTGLDFQPPAPLMGELPSVDSRGLASESMSPKVKDYIAQKYIQKSEPTQSISDKASVDVDPFSDSKREEMKKLALDKQSGLGWLQFGAGVGDAIAGRSNAATNEYFDKIRSNIDAKTVGDFDKRKRQSQEDAVFKRQQDQFDPNSTASQSFRKIIEANFPKVAQAYGDKWKDVSAADQDAIFRPLQLKENIEARKETARISAQQRADAKEIRNDERARERMTIYGEARTADDAKKLKEASELKSNFDSKLQEMIDLRNKHGGGAILNREDVARGKQLSKDLLLAYKDMAKLGVLSISDMNILNKIIPDDPLAYDFIPGQDPIQSNLEKFKIDTEKDFNNRLNNRLLNPPKQTPSINQNSTNKPSWAK